MYVDAPTGLSLYIGHILLYHYALRVALNLLTYQTLKSAVIFPLHATCSYFRVINMIIKF